MKSTEAILYSLKMSDQLVHGYLDDMNQEEWLERAVTGSNHVTWQVGHLLKSTAGLAATTMPGKLPELPNGFGEHYTSETAGSDSLDDFHPREELMSLYEEQYAALCSAVESLTDEALSQPVPESISRLGKSVGEIAAFQPLHWLMHVGQWAIIRRKLGRPPLF